MKQDTFNKVITTSLLLYAFIMFTWSFIAGKSIDLNSYMVLLAPLLTHIAHLLSNKITDRAGSNGHG